MVMDAILQGGMDAILQGGMDESLPAIEDRAGRDRSRLSRTIPDLA